MDALDHINCSDNTTHVTLADLHSRIAAMPRIPVAAAVLEEASLVAGAPEADDANAGDDVSSKTVLTSYLWYWSHAISPVSPFSTLPGGNQ